ncbi:MAG: kinase, partial [Rhizorhabdus sp.]|nr:kinase [Rhizorhabdus sp.]
MTERRMALVASPTPAAQAAAEELRSLYEWYPIERADLVIALGGDGYMLRTLHNMLDRHRILPIFGMNLGTVGFLMNEWKPDLLELRVQHAKSMTVLPLRMDAVTVDGQRFSIPAINEVSLLRETRETAKL